MTNDTASPVASNDNDPDRTLEIVRHFPADAARLFAAWTDPEEIMRWFGPVDVSIPECEVDLRVGGPWRAVMENSRGDRYYVSGHYVEITPPERLAFTWAWTADGVKGHETIVTLDFIEQDGGTRMRFHQALFADPGDRAHHEKGWTSAFDGFAARIEGKPLR